MSLFRTKKVAHLQHEAASEKGLHRTLGTGNLVSLGIGSVVGAGIFVLSGQAAAQYAGPAIALSFVISGLGCLFAGLCYAEFAAMIPVAGSAYTYSYATMGELMAWIIGWDLILEYLFSGAAVAVGWSATFQDILREFGLSLPPALSQAPLALEQGHLVLTGAVVNLPAVGIVLVLTAILVVGIRESASFNNSMVLVKCGVLVVFVAYGAWFLFHHTDVLARNWTPFIPENTGRFGEFGVSGIFKGAAVIFFAYIGFDGVSTAAQETRNPQRDLPRGLLYTLLIVALLFISVSLVLTGMLHYTELNVDAPVIFALQKVGAPPAFRYLVEAAALAGLTSVALVSFLGQPRIFFSMANDGLLPPVFARIHPRFRTPHVTTLLTGGIGAIVAGAFPLDLLGELISIGTLMAFALVCGGILVLRRTQPDLPRPFRTPAVPLVPVLGVLTCLVQMAALPLDTWLRLAIWMGLGLAVYFGYSRRHSRLAPKAH